MVEQAGKARPGCVCEWVPAHGRHTDWRAPSGCQKESQRWRDLNDAADDAASSAAEQRWRSHMEPLIAAETAVKAQAQNSLLRVLRGEERWTSKWYND